MYRPRCVHSSIDGHLSCFHFLSIVNNVAMNMQVQIFLWDSAFNAFGYMSKYTQSGIYFPELNPDQILLGSHLYPAGSLPCLLYTSDAADDYLEV